MRGRLQFLFERMGGGRSKLHHRQIRLKTRDETRVHGHSIAWQVLTLVTRTSWKRGLLFWARFVAKPSLTLRWWKFASSFALARGYPLPHDELLQKPLSKFLVYGMKTAQRLQLLTEHFVIAEQILSRESMKRVWRGDVLNMGEITGRGETYTCLLMLADRCGGRHEGAFAVSLVRSRDQAWLSSGRFTFVRYALDGYTFVAGSMQGPRNAKRLIIEATRDLSGLRPKDAILMVLQGLVAEGGADHFFAISQAKHPIRYRRGRRQSMMRTNIDSFWLERNAEPEATYGFIVTCSRTDGSGKRNESKARFSTLGELFY
jgi:uncharacterized protein VirK/YbjX